MSTPLITIARGPRAVLERVHAAASPSRSSIDDALGPRAGRRRARRRRRPAVPLLGDGRLRDPRRGRRARAERRRRVARRHAHGPRRCGDGEAIRISTGAAVPAGATAVIPQEDVDAHDGATIETAAAAVRGRERPRRRRGHARRHDRARRRDRAGRGRARRRRRRRRRHRHRRARGRASRCCAPATSCARPGEPLGPGEIHNSNAPMLTGLAANAGALTGPRQRIPDDRGATRRHRRRARALGRRDHLRRRLGRTARPRQAGAGRARRPRGVLERLAAAGQADLVRDRRRAPARVRAARQSRLGRGHVLAVRRARRWRRCRAPTPAPHARARGGARRGRQAQSAARAGGPRAAARAATAGRWRPPTAPRARTSSPR